MTKKLSPDIALVPSIDNPSAPTPLDASFLESLIGYNSRRAAACIIDIFLQRMVVYGLRTADFSMLSLVGHNPGITSRELCAALGILPPNLVRIVADLDTRGLLLRKPHPTDGRAIGLHLSAEGKRMLRDAERTVRQLEDDAAHRLTAAEQKLLISLLKKIYQP